MKHMDHAMKGKLEYSEYASRGKKTVFIIWMNENVHRNV